MLEWTYCVVGNITKNHTDDKGIVRYGTSAFAGGTKVYLGGRNWNRYKNRINVLGLTRRKRWEVIWTDISHIENLRVQKVFHKTVLDKMRDLEGCACWWGQSKKERTLAEAFVNEWNADTVQGIRRHTHRAMVYGDLSGECCREKWVQLSCHSGPVSDIWMSCDMWFRPIEIDTADYRRMNLPESLKNVIDMWRRKAQNEKNVFAQDWKEENVSLRFVWFGEFYQIFPSALRITPEQFRRFSVEMQRQLYMTGCPYAQCTGTQN